MTQGLLSIVDKETGAVRFKIIAGCKGDRVVKLAAALRSSIEIGDSAFTLAGLRMGAAVCNLGCSDCLVVMDEKETLMSPESHGVEELSLRYRNTFHLPRTNPRWEIGTADYVEIVEM
jgi:hypothetical protein